MVGCYFVKPKCLFLLFACPDDLVEADSMEVYRAAIELYALIHARFIVTTKGLSLMVCVSKRRYATQRFYFRMINLSKLVSDFAPASTAKSSVFFLVMSLRGFFCLSGPILRFLFQWALRIKQKCIMFIYTVLVVRSATLVIVSNNFCGH